MTEKKMPRDYWFHAIQQSCRMTNQISAKVDVKLTTLFKIFHHVAPDTRTWIPLLSIAYFYKYLDNNKDRTTFQSKSMIGIAVGRSTKTNALSIYNHTTKQYYEPYTYTFYPYHLPCTKLPSHIHYDRGLHADLYHHSHKNTPELYPLGMPLKIPSNEDDDKNYTTDIVSSIPIRDPSGNTVPCQYLLQLHDGSTFTKALTRMNAG